MGGERERDSQVCVCPGSSRLIIALLSTPAHLGNSDHHNGPQVPLVTPSLTPMVTRLTDITIPIPTTPGVTGTGTQRQARGPSDIIIYESQTSSDTRMSQHWPLPPLLSVSAPVTTFSRCFRTSGLCQCVSAEYVVHEIFYLFFRNKGLTKEHVHNIDMYVY